MEKITSEIQSYLFDACKKSENIEDFITHYYNAFDGDEEEHAALLYDVAILMKKNGNGKCFEAAIKESLRLYEHLQIDLGIFACIQEWIHFNIGVAHLEELEYWFLKSDDVLKRYDPSTWEASFAYYKTGWNTKRMDYLSMMGQTEEAIKIAEENIELLEKGDVHMLTHSHVSLGNLQRNTGYYLEAMESYLRAIQIKGNEGLGLATAWHGLGNMHEHFDQKNEALSALVKAHELYEEYGDIYDLTNLKVAISLVYFSNALSAAKNGELDLGNEDLQSAWSIMTEAFKMAIESGDGYALADILSKLGDYSSKLSQFEQAEQYLQQALDVIRPLNAQHLETEIQLSLADNSMYQHQWEKAISHYEKSLEIMGNDFEIYSIPILRGLGVAHAHLDDDKAEHYFEQGIQIIEKLEGSQEKLDLKLRYRAQHLQLYRELVHLHIEKGKPRAAFKVLEQSKARTLLDNMRFQNELDDTYILGFREVKSLLET